ncbi:TolC family protein [Robertkochia sediminum]|uniref:TolC family protein n=1 Tax=Robertkochia sediminum TaxID=2785326 RepID=UPI00193129E3|nr:TolC family protein [Robertkochia sediminum]MBL7471439.1 TolC family protein [Robertkochia sediminum]
MHPRIILFIGTCVFSLLLTLHPAYAQQSPEFRIALMMEVQTEESEQLLGELQQEITRVVGEDARVTFPKELFKVNNFNIETARAQYRELQVSDADLILSIGTLNNEVLLKDPVFPKPVISFAGINAPGLKLPLEGETSGVPNFHYLVTNQSLENDLKTFHKLTQFNKVGIMLRKAFYEALNLKETFDKVTAELGVEHELLFYERAEELAPQLDAVDAVYLAEAFYLTDAEIKDLANALIDRKIPSFTSSFYNDVSNGIMATNQGADNFTRIFRRIALNVQQYISGTPLEDMPVFLDLNEQLTLNINTINRIELPLKYSLLAGSNILGNYSGIPVDYTYNLLELIDKTLRDNLQLQQQQKDVELSGQDVKFAGSSYLPNVNAAASGSYRDAGRTFSPLLPEFATQGNLSVNQLVFSEAANANISIQKRLREAQEEQFNTATLDAILQVSSLYFNALISKINLSIQRENRDLTRRNLQLAEQNYRAGQSGRTDMLRFRSEMAQNTQSLIEASNQLSVAYIDIKRQINIPLDIPIAIQDAELGRGVFTSYNYDKLSDLLDNPKLREPFIAFLIEEAERNLPEFKVLDRTLEATERNIKFNTTGRLLPQLGLQGGYTYDFNQWGEGAGDLRPKGFLTAGVNVSLPIFQQNRFSIERQTSEIQKDQLEIQRSGLVQNNETNIRAVVYNLINQVSNIRLSEISAETAREVLQLTQESYTQGAVNIVQLIDAQNNLLRAQLAQSNATYNYLLNAIQLERLIGYSFLLHTPEENIEFEQRFIEYLDQN